MSGGIEGSRRLQATSNLNSDEWADLTTYSVIYTNAQSTVRFSDQAATNFARRYYRIVSP